METNIPEDKGDITLNLPDASREISVVSLIFPDQLLSKDFRMFALSKVYVLL